LNTKIANLRESLSSVNTTPKPKTNQGNNQELTSLRSQLGDLERQKDGLLSSIVQDEKSGSRNDNLISKLQSQISELNEALIQSQETLVALRENIQKNSK